MKPLTSKLNSTLLHGSPVSVKKRASEDIAQYLPKTWIEFEYCVLEDCVCPSNRWLLREMKAKCSGSQYHRKNSTHLHLEPPACYCILLRRRGAAAFLEVATSNVRLGAWCWLDSPQKGLLVGSLIGRLATRWCLPPEAVRPLWWADFAREFVAWRPIPIRLLTSRVAFGFVQVSLEQKSWRE